MVDTFKWIVPQGWKLYREIEVLMCPNNLEYIVYWKGFFVLNLLNEALKKFNTLEEAIAYYEMVINV